MLFSPIKFIILYVQTKMHQTKRENKMNKFNFPPHLKVAFSQLNIIEYLGEESNPEVEKYFQNMQTDLIADDEIPWCSAFVNWCLSQVRIQGTGLLTAKSYLNWSEEIVEPELGCVAVYDRGRHSWQGHVNFFLSKKYSYNIGIGGNTNNSVNIERRNIKDVVSYRKVPVLKDFQDIFYQLLRRKKT